MCLHIASIKSTAGNRTKFFPSPFFISTSWFCILVEAFLNDHVAACSTALRSATEKYEMGGYVTVPCSSKWHSVVAHRIGLSSSDVNWLVATQHIRNKYSLLKSRSVFIVVINTANSSTLSILICITAQVNAKKVDLYNN